MRSKLGIGLVSMTMGCAITVVPKREVPRAKPVQDTRSVQRKLVECVRNHPKTKFSAWTKRGEKPIPRYSARVYLLDGEIVYSVEHLNHRDQPGADPFANDVLNLSRLRDRQTTTFTIGYGIDDVRAPEGIVSFGADRGMLTKDLPREKLKTFQGYYDAMTIQALEVCER